MNNQFEPDEKGYPFNPFSYVDKEGELHSDVTLPDYKAKDAELKKKLEEKYQSVKENTIKNNLGKTKMNILKILLSVAALVIAFAFVYLFPASGAEEVVVAIATALAGAFGIVDWRIKYDQIKAWYKSKSIVGAILASVGVLLIVVLPLFLTLPAWLLSFLTVISSVGGGTALIGIINAIIKKN